jgi:hypothetical protein
VLAVLGSSFLSSRTMPFWTSITTSPDLINIGFKSIIETAKWIREKSLINNNAFVSGLPHTSQGLDKSSMERLVVETI